VKNPGITNTISRDRVCGQGLFIFYPQTRAQLINVEAKDVIVPRCGERDAVLGISIRKFLGSVFLTESSVAALIKPSSDTQRPKASKCTGNCKLES